MLNAREYDLYGIDKKRFLEVLHALLELSYDDMILLAERASDKCTAKYLVESIMDKSSYDKLEAKYGIIPMSKSVFYRKRRYMFHLMDVDMKLNKFGKE